MKTTLTSTLVVLCAALLVTLTLASCASGRTRHGYGGWHNMGTGPKDSMPMPDANMPAKR